MTQFPVPAARPGPYRRPGAYRMPRAHVHRSPGPSRPWTNDGAKFIVAILVAGGVVIGMASGAGIVTQLSAYTAIAIGLVSPTTGLLIICVLAPLKTPLGAVPPPQLNTLLAASMVVGTVLRLPLERPRLRVGAPLAILLALFTYATVQQIPDMLAGWSGDRGYLVGSLFIQVATGLMVLFVALIVLRGRSPYVFLAALLTGAIVAAILGIVSFEQTVQGPLANLLGKAADTSRATGSFGDPNYYGLFLAMASVVGIALLSECRTRWLRVVITLGVVVTVAAMLVSLSRGAMLALGAGLMSMAFGRSRRTGMVAVGLGLLVLLLVYPLFVEWRLTNLTGSASAASVRLQDDSDAGRLTGVLAGVQLWLSAPVFGVGFGQYSYAVVEAGVSGFRVASHNWYMNLLGELGLFGLGLWLVLTFLLGRAVLSVPRPARTVGTGVLSCLAVGMLFAEIPMSFQTAALPIVVIASVLVAEWRTPEFRDDVGTRGWSPKPSMLERT